MTTPNADYVRHLRESAQSILLAVQSLEDHDVTADDNDFSNLGYLLEQADGAAWSLVDWISNGRPDE